jgi:nicotinamidase/pyrazinamidase
MNALLIVDIQNDFCPGGQLAVPDGNKIIPTVNHLSARFERVIFTQDWHPLGHHSFASTHNGKEPFDRVQMPYGEQTLWPDHCVQGSRGADFHPELITDRAQMIVRKGYRKKIDSYSAFFENDHQTRTGLRGYLKDRGITKLFICGLATDFCVKWSVLDGLDEGFDITVIEDAIKGIDLEGSVDTALDEMKHAGATFKTSGELA